MVQQRLSLAIIGLLCATLTQGNELQGRRVYAGGRRTIAVTPRVRWVRDARGRMMLRRDLALAGRILVVGSPGTSVADFERAARRAGGRLARVLPRVGMAVVELSESADLAAAAAACRALPFVRHAGPDRICYLRFDPNDPLLFRQGHFTPIRSRQAWDTEQGSSNVVIAVVDGGVDLDHPDLAGKIWSNPGEAPGNGLDDDGNGFVDDVHGWDFSPGSPDRTDPNPDPDGNDNDGDGTPDDQVTHGTLVAGTAAAIGNNGVGVAGVDWGATIMPIQIFADDGGTPVSTVIDGMEYAIDKGADIINLSLGTDFFDSSFTPAVERAHSEGILIVTAAGNSSEEYTTNRSTWQSPICNDGPNAGDNFVLGLTATNNSDVKASFAAFDSSGASFVDVVAPGVNIFGTLYQNPAFPNLQDFYGAIDGTSFSTAQTSGLAGLLLAADPTLTPDQLIATIRNTADDIDGLNPNFAGKLGAGRINCEAALRSLDTPPGAVTDLVAADTPFDTGGSLAVTWRKSSDDGGGQGDVTGYDIRRATAPGGPFESRGTVSPGTEQFEDATIDGVDYFYVVRTLEDDQHTDSGVVGPVRSVDNSASTIVGFPGGFSFIGLFVQPADQDPAALFGAQPPESLDWARYDPAADGYRLLAESPADPFLQIQLGVGYWLRLPAPAVVEPTGFAASPGPYVTPLVPGWNQVGNPFDGPVDFTGLRVVAGGQERTLTDAALLGVINPSGWLYDAQASEYVPLNELLDGAATEIPTSAAFWMLAFEEAGLKIPRPGAAAAFRSASRSLATTAAEGDWQAQLVARAGGRMDSYNFFGQRRGTGTAGAIPEPPPPPGPYVSLYFLGPDDLGVAAGGGRRGTARLASYFSAGSATEVEWPFVVECTVPMAQVEVSCPDLSALPRQYQVMLTDLDSGRRQFLRARRVYTYSSGPAPSRRRFVLTVSPRIHGALTIAGVVAVPMRGTGTEISFQLSRSAAVDVEIFNVAGRPVRTVSRSELLPGGRTALVWDGRTDAGGRAPPGVYLVRVRAATDEGQSGTAVTHVYVGR